MADQYAALQSATDEFLSNAQREATRGSSRRDDGDRERSRSHRADDDDRHAARSSRRRGYDEVDDRSSRSDRDRPRDRDRERERYGRDDRDRDYRSARRDDDRRGGGDRWRGGRDDGYSSRRDPYADRYGSDPYAPRGGYRQDPYDRRGGGGGYRDDYGGRGGGGGGGWRDAPREPSPALRRSPTPPGTIPLSQRKRRDTKWDIVPEGFDGVSALQAKATGLFGVPGQSRTLGMPAPTLGRDESGRPIVPSTLPPIRIGGDSLSAVAAMAPVGGNRQARRLYLGNVGWEANESNMLGFFNGKMAEMNFGIGPGDPAISAQVNGEKGYAFVEFRSPEEATKAMSFDGIVFLGQSLKIRRPKDYVGPDIHPPTALHVPGVISTNVPDTPNKIYIGGLPTYLNEEQVIELLKAFGELRAFNLVRETGNGPSKGFAFCEYVDPNLTDVACQGLDGMELGDRKLVVQRAASGQKGGMMPFNPSASGANAGPLGMGLRQFGQTGAPPSAEQGEPTRNMTMLNMVTTQELMDDEEYGDIVEDIREECQKYGAVLDVRIPRPSSQSKGKAASDWEKSKEGEEAAAGGEGKEREAVGRVYVRFEEVEQCKAAMQAIAGRQFGGRLVICAYLKEEDWPGDEDGGQNADETNAQATGPKFQAEAA